jgi:hypothetical protein
LLQSPYVAQFVVGQPLNLVKVLHFQGADPQTGLFAFEDKNKDGRISIDYTAKTVDDRHVLITSPKFEGGLRNTFSYKNWGLSIFFYFKKQIGSNAMASLSIPGDVNNQPIDVLTRWQKPGDVSNAGRFSTNSYSDNYTNYQSSDAIYTDASFIRLQNLTLTYTLPEKIMGSKGNCKVYVKGENLFIITRYNGLDPEVQNFGSMPRARVIVAGISCNL